MKIEFRRERKHEDDDIKGFWVGACGGVDIALFIIKWEKGFLRESGQAERFTLSYDSNDSLLVYNIVNITHKCDVYIKAHGTADGLTIELPEVINETA